MTEIERLLIERACSRLIAEYCYLVDHGEAASAAALFSTDGIWHSGEITMTGREEIFAGFTIREKNTSRMTRHFCSNILIDVQDEDNATGRAYLACFRHDGDPGRQFSPTGAPKVVGDLNDTFIRTADGWKFSRRDLLPSFIEIGD